MDLRDAVVVVTGASSGIGRATALAFARAGAAVVAAARRPEPLDNVTRECARLAGRALSVPTDVTDVDAVEDLAQRAVQAFGRIDVWVNNAAVTLVSRFEEAPYRQFRRVVDTNFFGYVHGARAVLPYFRERGQGVLINVSSILGKVAAPFQSPYVASKFAVNGLSESLRMELRDWANIHVCTVMFPSIDTPLYQHAANYAGRVFKPVPPIYRPERVAEEVVAVARRPRREVIVGGGGKLLHAMRTLAPSLAERFMARKSEREHFGDQPAAPTSGNVLRPMDFGVQASGGWTASRSMRRRTGPAFFAALGAVLLVAGGVLLWNRLVSRRRSHRGSMLGR